MIVHLLKRLALLVASTAVASVVVFAFMSVLPGGPGRGGARDGDSDAAVVAARPAVRHSTGRSWCSTALGVRAVARRLRNLLRDAARRSGRRSPTGFSVTAWLVFGGMVIALLIAIPPGRSPRCTTGTRSARWRRGCRRSAIAVPAFLAGILLVYVFAVRAQAVPSGGCTPLAQDPGSGSSSLVLPLVVARAGAGGRADPLCPVGGARRDARGLPPDRPGQGAEPDGGAVAARAAQRRRAGGDRARPAAGDAADRRRGGGAGVRDPRPRAPAADRGGQPRPARWCRTW